jgi:hypothetical protein
MTTGIGNKCEVKLQQNSFPRTAQTNALKGAKLRSTYLQEQLVTVTQRNLSYPNLNENALVAKDELQSISFSLSYQYLPFSLSVSLSLSTWET